MFVESFHRLLKVVYFDNQSNRRIDELLHVLVKIARNLVFEKLLRQSEENWLTENVRDINQLLSYWESWLRPRYRMVHIKSNLSKKMNTTLLKSFHRIVHANLIVPNAISAHTYIHVHAGMLLCIVLCVNMYICSV